jgi:hypothetical protein
MRILSHGDTLASGWEQPLGTVILIILFVFQQFMMRLLAATHTQASQPSRRFV